MGVDIVHRLRLHSGVRQGLGHAGGSPRAAGGGGGDVVGVAVGAVADHLGVNPGAPGLGVSVFLQQKGARPLPHDKAGALRVKGNGRPKGVGALRQGLHSGKAPHGQRGDGGFRPAAQHYLSVAVPDVAECVAHGVGPSGAGGDHTGAHPLEPIPDSHVARRHVGDNHGNHKRGHGVPAPLAPSLVGLAHRLKAADAAGKNHAASVQFLLFPVQTGVGHALIRGDEGQLSKAVHLFRVPPAQQAVNVQIFHLTGQLHLHFRCVVPGYGSDAALARLNRAPAFRHRIPQRIHGAHAGDYNSALFHLVHLIKRPCRRPRTAPVR